MEGYFFLGSMVPIDRKERVSDVDRSPVLVFWLLRAAFEARLTKARGDKSMHFLWCDCGSAEKGLLGCFEMATICRPASRAVFNASRQPSVRFRVVHVGGGSREASVIGIVDWSAPGDRPGGPPQNPPPARATEKSSRGCYLSDTVQIAPEKWRIPGRLVAPSFWASFRPEKTWPH